MAEGGSDVRAMWHKAWCCNNLRGSARPVGAAVVLLPTRRTTEREAVQLRTQQVPCSCQEGRRWPSVGSRSSYCNEIARPNGWRMCSITCPSIASWHN
jgi:hypothetical protein